MRRKCPQAESDRLTIASDTIMIDLCDDHGEYHIEKEEDVCTSTKRLLPDRTHAAHNRANEKLVYFIVKQRMVEPHLLVRILSDPFINVRLPISLSTYFIIRMERVNVFRDDLTIELG